MPPLDEGAWFFPVQLPGISVAEACAAHASARKIITGSLKSKV